METLESRLARLNNIFEQLQRLSLKAINARHTNLSLASICSSAHLVIVNARMQSERQPDRSRYHNVDRRPAVHLEVHPCDEEELGKAGRHAGRNTSRHLPMGKIVTP